MPFIVNINLSFSFDFGFFWRNTPAGLDVIFLYFYKIGRACPAPPFRLRRESAYRR